MHTQREFLSMIQVQRELGLPERHVAELIASRKLPAFRVMGLWRIERKMLDQLIDELYYESFDAISDLQRSVVRRRCRFDPDVPPQAGNRPDSEAAEAQIACHDTEEKILANENSAPGVGRPEGVLAGLTDQQKRIAKLVGSGMSNAEIAAHLSVEISTVKSHVSRILQRCAVRDRAQLIVKVWRSGFMSNL